MTSNFRNLSLGLAAAATLFATPAFAQKGTSSPTPVIEAEKPARTAVQIDYECYNYSCSTAYQVPSGMRFVAESLVAWLTQIAPSSGIVSITPELDGVPQQPLSFFQSGGYTFSTTTSNFLNHPIRFYSDSAPLVALAMAAYPGRVSLVGHLQRK